MSELVISKLWPSKYFAHLQFTSKAVAGSRPMSSFLCSTRLARLKNDDCGLHTAAVSKSLLAVIRPGSQATSGTPSNPSTPIPTLHLVPHYTIHIFSNFLKGKSRSPPPSPPPLHFSSSMLPRRPGGDPREKRQGCQNSCSSSAMPLSVPDCWRPQGFQSAT